MAEFEGSYMPEGRICQSESYMPEFVVPCCKERLHLRAPRLPRTSLQALQGYLAHKKQPTP